MSINIPKWFLDNSLKTNTYFLNTESKVKDKTTVEIHLLQSHRSSEGYLVKERLGLINLIVVSVGTLGS